MASAKWFLAIFLIPTVQSCLVVYRAAPTQCSCVAQAVGPTNWDSVITDANPIYKKLSDSEIGYPNVTRDGCSVTISCPDTYRLVIYDQKKSFDYEYRQANGVCTLETTQWTFGNGETFGKVYATCIESRPPMCEPTEPWMKHIWIGIANGLQKSTVEGVLDYFGDYKGNTSNYYFALMRFDRPYLGVLSSDNLPWWIDQIRNKELAEMQDPSLTFEDSDILSLINTHIWNDRMCGMRFLILLERWPLEYPDLTKMIDRLRAMRASVFVFAIKGNTKETDIGRVQMERLARETQGYLALEDTEAEMLEAFKKAETIEHPYIVYSVNAINAEGKGGYYIPDVFPQYNASTRAIISISNPGMAGESSVGFTLLHEDEYRSELIALASRNQNFAKRNWAVSDHTWEWGIPPSWWHLQTFNQYFAHLAWNFPENWRQNISLRIYSSQPVTKWVPFDDGYLQGLPIRCSCVAQAVGPTNWDSVITEDNPLYQNLTEYEIAYPNLVRGDCSVTISCSGVYQLVIYDENKSYNYGDQQAEGFCGITGKQWYFGNGEIFGKVYATCIEYYKPMCEPIEPWMKHIWVSFANGLQKSTVESVLDFFEDYKGNTSNYYFALLRFDRSYTNILSSANLPWWIDTIRNEYLPEMQDHSLTFEDSDVLSRINTHIWNDRMCGMRFLVLLERWPLEYPDLDKMIMRLRTMRASVFVFAIKGNTKETDIGRVQMERLARETQGYLALEDTEAEMLEAFKKAETIEHPYIVYSVNALNVEGQGGYYIPDVFPQYNANTRAIISISNPGMAGESSVGFTQARDDEYRSELIALAGRNQNFAKRNWAVSDHTWEWGVPPRYWHTQIFNQYFAHLQWNFPEGWKQNISLRIYSSQPVTKWVPFDEGYQQGYFE